MNSIPTVMFVPQLEANSLNSGHYIVGSTQHNLAPPNIGAVKLYQMPAPTPILQPAQTFVGLQQFHHTQLPMQHPQLPMPLSQLPIQQSQPLIQPAPVQHSQSAPILLSQPEPIQSQGCTYYHQSSNLYFYNSKMTQGSPAASKKLGATKDTDEITAGSNSTTSPDKCTAPKEKLNEPNEKDSKINTDKPEETSIVMPSKEPESSSTSLSEIVTEELPTPTAATTPTATTTATATATATTPTATNSQVAPPANKSAGQPKRQYYRRRYYNYNKKKQQSHTTEKNDTIINKKSTKCSNLQRSNSQSTLITVTTTTTTTTTKLQVADGATINVSNNKNTKYGEEAKKQNDPMQRNSSKGSHSASGSTNTTSNSTKSQNTNKNQDSSDSGLSSQTQHRHHHHHYQNRSVKQRKARGGSRRQDAAAPAAVADTATNTATASSNQINAAKASAPHQKRSAGTPTFTVSDWLQNDLYCYDRRYISSCGEDKRNARHNTGHRNSTSSEATGSEDLNSGSSYDDQCSAYVVQSKTGKKCTKSRQKRQQKRKQQLSSASAATAGTTTQNVTASQQQPMDIDDENKENRKPGAAHKQQSSAAAALNLRKECTKAAAMKAALNNDKYSKCQMGNVLTTSPSNSSVCSFLSSASSTTSASSSMSSSASSSPAHSNNSSPTASPTVTKRNADHLKKMVHALVPPLRQFTKLNSNESHMAQQLRQYLIDPSLLKVYGFPVESENFHGCIEIYKCLPKHLAEEAVTKDNQRHHRHFYGRRKIVNSKTKTKAANGFEGLPSSAQWLSFAGMDSGNGSGDSSSSPFTDSDSSEMVEDDVIAQETPVMTFYTPDGVFQVFSEYNNSEEKQCVRCNKMFKVNAQGEYQTFDACSYHWGKLNNVYNGKCYVNIHSCCQGVEYSEGCSQHPLHVWNGCVVGINGPYRDYVHTRPRGDKNRQKHSKIYAIDCEMSYTGLGLEVTKVTVVGYDGSLVYEHFVQPVAAIADYNTRFSGITEEDLSPHSNKALKTFAQMQQDLLRLFDADTILIGHGLDNDLRALRLVHKTIVDTSLVFGHSTGFPYRRSLKNLTRSFLKRDIQCSDMGHSSFEDSRACLELMMWKLRKEPLLWTTTQ